MSLNSEKYKFTQSVKISSRINGITITTKKIQHIKQRHCDTENKTGCKNRHQIIQKGGWIVIKNTIQKKDSIKGPSAWQMNVVNKVQSIKRSNTDTKHIQQGNTRNE